MNERIVMVVIPEFAEGTPEATITRVPEGSEGWYDIRVGLGTPGRQTFFDNANIDELFRNAESLLRVRPGTASLRIRIGAEGLSGQLALIPNSNGVLSSIQLRVRANGFGDAEIAAHHAVLPLLSLLAFQSDVALDAVVYEIREAATESRRFRFGVIGDEKLLTFSGEGPHFETTGECRIPLSAYREGLNTTNPFFRVLCFYKVIEWISRRRSQRRSERYPDEKIPERPEEWPRDFLGSPAAEFRPYIGRRFEQVRETLRGTIRNAIAHLTPDEEILVADHIEDEGKCERAVPVVKFMARRMLQNEIARITAGASEQIPPRQPDQT